MRTRQGRTAERQDAEVTAWRWQQLNAAGFDAPLAATLAGDRQRDLHALLELVERGCPPHLAARILSPLDRESSR